MHRLLLRGLVRSLLLQRRALGTQRSRVGHAELRRRSRGHGCHSLKGVDQTYSRTGLKERHERRHATCRAGLDHRPDLTAYGEDALIGALLLERGARQAEGRDGPHGRCLGRGCFPHVERHILLDRLRLHLLPLLLVVCSVVHEWLAFLLVQLLLLIGLLISVITVGRIILGCTEGVQMV